MLTLCKVGYYLLENGNHFGCIACWDIVKLSVEKTDLDTNWITKWLHHSRKQSNETVDKERLAWQAIASLLVMKHLNTEIFFNEGKW